MLLSGNPVRGKDAAGWLVDWAGPLDEALQVAWNIATDGDHGLKRREVETGALAGVPTQVPLLPGGADPGTEAARKAIVDTVQAACGAPLADALELQTRHSAEFMTSEHCRRGRVGAERARTVVA